ncbi:MAG: hypothetical protein KDE01_01720 [Caldilineaceae bacterium]|nr:hypothetical protein [Caldilineaceae bacterium]
MKLVSGVVDVYTEQQRAALAGIQSETIDRRGFLSDANMVAERRKTSRMYLLHYTGVTAIVSGGLVLLAHGAGYLDAGGAFATWLSITGALALILAWVRHGDEFKHSPEGIARHLIDWHGSTVAYEAATKRMALRWEHESEQDKRNRADAAAERARLATLEAERQRNERHERDAQQRAEMDRVLDLLEARSATKRAAVDPIHLDGATTAPAPPERAQTAPTWQEGLAEWVVGLYVNDGAISESGAVKIRAPWSARGDWPDDAKHEMKRVVLHRKPALFEQLGGGRLRLRTELFDTPDVAMAALSARLSE